MASLPFTPAVSAASSGSTDAQASGWLQAVSALLHQALALPSGRLAAERDTPLLGAVPELDSMAVVSLLTAIEERFDITLDESDLSASTFATLGSLSDYIGAQISAQAQR